MGAGLVSIIIGAQWGDEGKGRWVDILSKDVDMVARFQGGTNAGHTIYVNNEKIVLHQIPSGVFQPKLDCALTAGVVLNPVAFLRELGEVQRFAPAEPRRIWVSARCHVITPWHVFLDAKQEQEASRPIGTTKRGIGPTYADKYRRAGLRLGDYVNPKARARWIESQVQHSSEFAAHYGSSRESWAEFERCAETIKPFVCNAEQKIRDQLAKGKRLLLEGAQGSLLDIDHGTYPYVTSSSTCAGGAFASLGFSPKKIDKIYGLAKAYLTRVGEGPMPTELKDEVGKLLGKKGNEFGATTGRPRRCGWLDMVALRYATQVNGLDGLILNKFDILSGLEEIKLCVAYEHPEQGRLEEFPWDIETLAACRPVYESFSGWDLGTEKPCQRIADMPKNALKYIAAIESGLGIPVSMVGTGVNRADAIYR